MQRALLLLGLGIAVAGAYACTATKQQQTFGAGGDTASSSTSAGGNGGAGGATHASSSTGEGGSLFDGGLTSGSGGGPPDCKDAAKLIYVIGEGNELYSFNPQNLAIQQVGTINCPQPPGSFATPFSMAVDRSATAWVLFNDGHIYNVDTTTAACKATGFPVGQDPNFMTFGMGFVSDAPGSTSETLYVGAYSGSGIATIDTTTLKLTPVGMYDMLHGPAEMTGTGDARLFGFFYNQGPGGGSTIAQIDKTTSHILNVAPQPGITIGAGWAFAFWGGEFYMFTAPNGKSRVDKYSPMTMQTTQVLPAIGLSVIVGAGVSTCAPIVPPK